MKNRLQTRDRLLKHNLIVDATCVLCNNDIETHDHLFFYYSCSFVILQQVMQWLGCNFTTKSLQTILYRCGNIKGNKMKKRALLCSIAATVYGVWKLRNDVLWRNTDASNSAYIVSHIRWSVKNRLLQLCDEDDRHYDWLQAL